MPARLQKLPYGEGDVFAVPLRDYGYALGVVARMDGKGLVLGYFFGPKLELISAAPDLASLEAHNAVSVRLLGDLGLIDLRWPVIGHIPEWDRTKWPLPQFRRGDDGVISYNETTLDEEREARATPEFCSQLPQDGLAGAGSIEKLLTRELR